MKSRLAKTSKGNILIVDDTPNNLRLLSVTLTQEGYEVRSAINGSMALTGAKMEPPDLVLLDIMMPDLSGYEVCQYLKADPITRDIPIIFISATNEVINKVKAFEVGGADYISKPFQVEEVLARVEHQLTIRRLQQQLQEKNIELENSNLELARSNAELERFAYIVSHDLQQPLQRVMTCSELLTLKYQHCLDNKANGYIERIKNTSLLMRKLIHDLLVYSRIDSQNQGLSVCDCNLIIEKVLTNLETEIALKKAVITCESLPHIPANEMQLIQLFQNLISNAIKFQPPEHSAVIKISIEPKSDFHTMGKDQWLFGVHDNGIGIDQQNFPQIFEIFRRLPESKNYPGTGIGLSTCKKIVENHGGCIWLESQLGVGTSFYFTLPMGNSY